MSMPAERGNPWVAVRPGENIGSLARKVAAAHQAFVDSADAPGVRSVVLDSWMRSRSKGVDPDGARDGRRPRRRRTRAVPVRAPDGADPPGGPQAARRGRRRHRTARRDHRRSRAGCCGSRATRAAKDRALAMNFVEGADWSEERVGHQRAGHRARARPLRADLRGRALQPHRARLELFGGARARPDDRADPRRHRHHRRPAGRGARGAVADPGHRRRRRVRAATAPAELAPHCSARNASRVSRCSDPNGRPSSATATG